MSENLINQITLNCLLNNNMLNKYLINQKVKKLNDEDINKYRNKIYELFKNIIYNNLKEEDINSDIKYAYDNFISTSINYFKITDNAYGNADDNDKYLFRDIKPEYNNIFNDDDDVCVKCQDDELFDINTHDFDVNIDINSSDINNFDINNNDNSQTRSIIINTQPVDKYVNISNIKPKYKTINTENKNTKTKISELKKRGKKKNNIGNLYEDCNEKEHYK